MKNALLEGPHTGNPYHENPNAVPSNEQLAHMVGNLDDLDSQPDWVLQDEGRVSYSGGHSTTTAERNRDAQALAEEKARIAAEATPSHITAEERLARTEATLSSHLSTYAPYEARTPVIGNGETPLHQTPVGVDYVHEPRDTSRRNTSQEAVFHVDDLRARRVSLLGRVSNYLRRRAYTGRHRT